MSLLNVAKTDDSIQDETDSVGGGGPLESGLYPFEVSLAYLMKSQGGAVGLNLHLKTDSGQEIRETLWIASGDAKGNKNYYETKQGERKYLPGFNHANSLALVTVGKELGELDTDEKVVSVYSPDAGAEVPTKVEMVMDLLGQRAIVGLQKQIVDKNARGDDGKYHPTGETRETNEIDKFFCARESHLYMTSAEIKAKAEEPAFYHTWDKKWTGQTRNRVASNDANGNSGAPKAAAKAAPAAGGSAKPTKSLFG